VNKELSNFAARLGALISRPSAAISPGQFSDLALELFALQCAHNPAYRQICEGLRVFPLAIKTWNQIPRVPTGAFKEIELSSLNPEERTAVFYSSGTTGQKNSRHFHNRESLNLYERSLWHSFADHFDRHNDFLFLTPPASAVPNSSLIHMFETLRKKCDSPISSFTGQLDQDGGWMVNFSASVGALERACSTGGPITVLGTAFSFVHLLDYLAENDRQFQLPAGSRVMETGGYKNRSRVLPKQELHTLIAKYLGVGRDGIICEYGMSELSSQAYDCASRSGESRKPAERKGSRGDAETRRRERAGSTAGQLPATTTEADGGRLTSSHPSPLPLSPSRGEGAAMGSVNHSDEVGHDRPDSIRGAAEAAAGRYFQFPPWARVQIISPETGEEVAAGETGLIRIFDLANVFSVAAIQTEDLGVRREMGFELVGRAQLAEPRGCSLMTS
jgi:hypothetical protein